MLAMQNRRVVAVDVAVEEDDVEVVLVESGENRLVNVGFEGERLDGPRGGGSLNTIQ